jgi:AcrR family transcriptional regulator
MNFVHHRQHDGSPRRRGSAVEEYMAGASVADRTQRSELAKAARREEILDAARRVFTRSGFKGTTIADVAEEAGIALGTIYLYFPSKDDLFRGLSARCWQMITESLSDGDDTATLERSVRSRLENVFKVCGENRDLLQLVVLNSDSTAKVEARARAEREHRFQPLVDALARGMEAGLLRRTSAATMTRLVLGWVSIAVYEAFVASDGRNADEIRDECGTMLIAYMQSPAQA